MATQPQKDFDVATGGSTVLYFRGHPQYDALRVEFDGASGSTDSDVTVKVDTNDDVNDVESNGFGAMDAEVYAETAVDPSSGVSVGTTALARTVAVEIDETTNTGAQNAAGTVYLHNSSDPAENAQSFANR
jgi:hypothetical protein